MNRRKYITTAGTVGLGTLAGCGGDDSGGGDGGSATTDDSGDDNLYQTGTEGELVPNGVASDWPDQDFERNDEINENFLRGFTNSDGSIVVLMDAEINETVSDAKDSFESSAATASEQEDYPLADQAIIFDSDTAARVIFRDSNALGQTLAVRESGGEAVSDRQRASSYAEIMYEGEW